MAVQLDLSSFCPAEHNRLQATVRISFHFERFEKHLPRNRAISSAASKLKLNSHAQRRGILEDRALAVEGIWELDEIGAGNSAVSS